MNVAVMSLCRDRLAYTQHCFASLHENSGIAFDHYVLDQASEDGTADWIRDYDPAFAYFSHKNVGVSCGMNLLLDVAVDARDYDVIVKFDNDCELLTPNTLRDVCTVADEWNLLLSPHIEGLRNKPGTVAQAECDGHTVSITPVIGGIFLAVPSYVFEDGYRHDEANPTWGGDDTGICAWWRSKGKHVGYLDGYTANHYLTTDGQHDDDPEYFERRVAEGGPV